MQGPHVATKRPYWQHPTFKDGVGMSRRGWVGSLSSAWCIKACSPPHPPNRGCGVSSCFSRWRRLFLAWGRFGESSSRAGFLPGRGSSGAGAKALTEQVRRRSSRITDGKARLIRSKPDSLECKLLNVPPEEHHLSKTITALIRLQYLRCKNIMLWSQTQVSQRHKSLEITIQKPFKSPIGEWKGKQDPQKAVRTSTDGVALNRKYLNRFPTSMLQILHSGLLLGACTAPARHKDHKAWNIKQAWRWQPNMLLTKWFSYRSCYWY